MSTASKSLSPSELAKLEHSFATDPSSEAYRPLAEAYLGMNRFMEAMVVCKKGVKAHPTRAEPRMLLARVYAEQGKDKKALDELVAATQVVTADKALWRMAGELQMKVGERDAAKTSLLKAHEIDPVDGETAAALKRYGIELPKPAAPPPPEPVAAVPRTETGPATGSAAVNGNAASGAVPGGAAPRRATTANVRRTSYEEIEAQDERDRRTRAKSTRKLMVAATTLAAALVVVSAGYYGYGQWHGAKLVEFTKQMKAATGELRHDSYASYQRATEAAEKALEAMPDALAAHGLLAYVWTIRWGEHGGGDMARAKAEEHLEAGKKINGTDPYLLAADALFLSYAGQNQKALNELTREVTALREERKESSTMNLTLGIVQMNAGDAEGARDSLMRAHDLAQSDPRIYATLGSLYRRQGQERQARDNFDGALRFERDHPESMLGKALLILERDAADYETAAKLLKRLIEMEPPPSPRQLATAHLGRALLIARVSKDLPEYNAEGQKTLLNTTGVPADKTKAQAEVNHEEELGFSLDARNPELRLLKGKRLALEGQIDAATQEIRAAIDLDKSRAQLYVELARVLMQKPGGEKEAISALTTALHTMGDSPKLLFMLGQAHQRDKNPAEALVQFQRATADAKVKNPDARLAMGSIYREQKNWNGAIDALDKAAKEFVGQGTKVAEVYTELGRVYDEKGDRTKADEVYQWALKADVDYSPTYFFYGRFMAQGDRAQLPKAREALQQYLKREPRGEFAEEARKLAPM